MNWSTITGPKLVAAKDGMKSLNERRGPVHKFFATFLLEGDAHLGDSWIVNMNARLIVGWDLTICFRFVQVSGGGTMKVTSPIHFGMNGSPGVQPV